MTFVFDSTRAEMAFDTGAHEATIKRAGLKQAESGTMYVNLLWEDVDGRSIWDKLFFTEKSIKRAVAFLEAIGRVGELDGKTIDPKMPESIAFLTQWAESLLGESATLEIEMKWSDYRNASEPNVRWYRPLDSITTADDLLDLDESLL